jgi:hypothetical protein
MIKDYKTLNSSSRLIFSKDFYGFGIGLNFKNAFSTREIFYVFTLDFICLRFWYIRYKAGSKHFC